MIMSNAAWRAEFLQLFRNPLTTMDNIDQAFKIKNKNLPRILYRYRPSKDHSLDELEHDSVFVSQPSGQNDILDSICTISAAGIFRDFLRIRFAQIMKQADPENQFSAEQQKHCAQSEDPLEALLELSVANASPDQKTEFHAVREVIQKFIETENEKTVGPLREIAQKHLRICCFTTDYQSTSMWDRYASQHAGLCIAYDFSLFPSDDLRRRWLYPVIYQDTPFDLTPFIFPQDKSNPIHPLLPTLASMHKSADWSNENEWRLILPPEVMPNPTLLLLLKPSAVYLGTKMESTKRQRAEEIARRRRISIFKMDVSLQDRRLIATSL